MIEGTSKSQEAIVIQTASAIAESAPHVLKHRDSFAIIDQRGNIRPVRVRDHGLFRDGTRFLSHLLVTTGDQLPVLLSSEMNPTADLLTVDLTNPQLRTVTHHDTLHLRQEAVLWENTLYLRITAHNYGMQAVNFPLTIAFDADYVDVFEVRGMRREQRGTFHPAQVNEHQVRLSYTGLDDIQRRTHLSFNPQPNALDADSASYTLALEAGQHTEITMTVACRYLNESVATLDFEAVLAQLQSRHAHQAAQVCQIETTNERFNGWLDASRRDLLLLLTETEHGLYPYAGVPWFSTVFGRDGIITALQTLWFYPEVSRGVLAYLAARQATTEDLKRESEPGKILHETRSGEMANTGEIPFGGYYGTIDATPLFVVLAGRYFQRTDDRTFIESLLPHIEAALHWIDHYGDIDGDGFVEYRRKNEAGILQQGWKDSNDSVFYADGKLVEPPVALCEVQGYVYEAKLLAADIVEALGRQDRARQLRQQAASLRERFLDAFWLDDLGTYAIALDSNKQPCRVRSSNAGHCLFNGIADPAQAERITAQFLDPVFFSGWGIRTLATGEKRYNPMAYHNGTIWPHDNGLIASGMARYGFKDAAVQVLNALFETSLHMDLYRLPELFCGFERIQGAGPVRYPVACLPQAWASGSVFMILQACLGIRVDGIQGQLIFDRPVLPEYIDSLHIRNLPLGETQINITIRRHGGGVNVISDADINIIVNT